MILYMDYRPGKIKGSFKVKEEFSFSKPIEVKPDKSEQKIKYDDIFMYWEDTTLTEKEKKKRTMERLFKYYSQTYPNDKSFRNEE